MSFPLGTYLDLAKDPTIDVEKVIYHIDRDIEVLLNQVEQLKKIRLIAEKRKRNEKED